MTRQERQRIAVLRSNGMSYKAIATEMNIPVNSIKTFCRRNHLGGVRAIENLSDEQVQNGLIDTENRGNSGVVEGEMPPDDKNISAMGAVYKVSLVFADTDDENAIPDVLGMLIRSRIRQG